MRAAASVGRVGVLALSLGIGTAVVLGVPATAWADGRDGSTTSTTATDSTAAPETPRRNRSLNRRPAPAAVRPDKPHAAQSVAVPVVRATAPMTVPRPTLTAGRVLSTGTGMSASAPAPDAIATPAATAPPAMLAAPATSFVAASPAPLSGTDPTAPIQSAASWVMLAATRREIGAAAVAANLAPVIANVTVGTPVLLTGKVSGKVYATDPDGNPMTYAARTSGSKGTVSITYTGTYTYTPSAGARHNASTTGATSELTTDTITFTVTDSKGAATTTTATVPISPRNTAPTATLSTGLPNASGVVTGKVKGSDANGDTLTYTVPATTSKGAVSITSDGVFTYTPTVAARHAAAKIGASTATKADSFTVTVTDGHGGTKTVPVTVKISPSNAAPTATTTTSAPNAATGVVTGRVTGADDNGDTLVYTASAPTKGTVRLNADGTFTYTPTVAARTAARTAGATVTTDSFTVTVTDGYGGSTRVTLTPVVAPANTAPTANPTASAPNVDTGVVTGNVNATDAERDALTYNTGTFTTAKGSVTVNSNGAFVYTPTPTARHDAAAIGAVPADTSDSFSITVTDSYGAATVVPVSVAVGPSNAAPTGSATVGTPDAATGVIAGAVAGSDANGDTISYGGSGTTSKGSVSVAADGTFTYTPTSTARHAAAYLAALASAKTDTFNVVLTDGYGGITAVPVNVTILGANNAPTGSATVNFPDATTGLVAGAVLGADADTDALTYTGSGATAKGTVVVNSDGTFTYTPTAAARMNAAVDIATAADKADSFTITVTDGYGGVLPVAVTVAVAPSVGQVAFNFTFTGTGWTTQTQSAIQSTAASLASYLVVNNPVTLNYTVNGIDDSGSGTLASAWTNFTSGSSGFYQTVSQSKILTGVDSNGASADAQLSWNFAYRWGTDSVTFRQYDMKAVALHEMLHALGFLTGVESSPNTNYTVFDSFLTTATGADPIGANYVWDPADLTNLTGGNGGLYFAGPNAVAAYGGLVPLYTPGSWESGSSISHVDDLAGYVMNPASNTGPGTRVIDAVELAMLKDLGYTVNSQPSVYAFFFFFGFGMLRRRRDR